MSQNQPTINNLFTPAVLLLDDTKKAMAMPRTTDLYSTGDFMLDEYLGGGWGRKGGRYEIVLIFADTGTGKSTFASQLAIQAALAGGRVAYYSLEDEKVDLCVRIYRQIGAFKSSKFDNTDDLFKTVAKQIAIAPEDDGYTLEQLATQVEGMFMTGSDVVIIDPLQFVFEASVVERTETEFNRQRLFMRQVNNIMKRTCKETGKSKTLVLVSHTNKGKYENAIDTIMGSGANKQVPTKIIQLTRDETIRMVKLVKTRFTKYRVGAHQISFDDETLTFRTAPVPPDHKGSPADWWDEVRAGWDRKGK